jgi:hypothetical protein
MQLTELKAFVKSHLTESEIKAFGYDLRTRESWETLADRCKEYAAAKLEQAKEATKEAAIEIIETAQILAENCDGLPVAIAETTQAALVWVLSQVIIGWLFLLEMAKEGAIDELMAQVEELNNPPFWRRVQGIDSDRDLWGYDELRDPRLALTVPIAG